MARRARPQMTCEQAQSIILSYANREHNATVLKMALEGLIEIEDGTLNDADAEASAHHIETCEVCQQWLDTFYPQRAAERAEQKRRTDIYCCTHMWHAVNDPDTATRFKFVLFRGEDPCWCINDDLCFAKHCPWCGTALPDVPFEDRQSKYGN